MKTYCDVAKCPAGHRFVIARRVGTAGKKVRTYCRQCERAYQIKAGPVPSQKSPDAGKDGS